MLPDTFGVWSGCACTHGNFRARKARSRCGGKCERQNSGDGRRQQCHVAFLTLRRAKFDRSLQSVLGDGTERVDVGDDLVDFDI